MVVRFLPVDDVPDEPAPERANLAEVIELRSLLAKFDASSAPHAAELAQVTRIGRQASSNETDTETPVDEVPKLPDIRQDATRLLARRALSSGELRAALVTRGHDAHEADLVLAEFEQALYLDDEGLARALCDKLRTSKRASRSQIRVKLRERKVPDAVAESVLSELDDDDEFTLMRTTATERASKLVGLDRQTAERRLLGYLQRRGWQGEPAFRAVRDALDGAAGGATSAHTSGVSFR